VDDPSVSEAKQRAPWRARSRSRRRWWRVALGLLGLSLFGAVLYVGGVDAWRQLLAADARWVGAAFGCTALLTFTSAARWALIANALAGRRLCSTRAYYHYLMMGRTAGLVLPEAVAVHSLGPLAMKAGGRASFRLAFVSLLIDKLFDLGLSGLFFLPTATFALQWIDVYTSAGILVGLFILVGALLWAWYRPLLSWAFGLRARLVERAERVPWLRRALETRLVRPLIALREDQAPPPRVARAAYGLTLLRYALMAARFAAVARAVGVDVPLLLVFVGIPIAQLGLLLGVTPGALGAMEAGWLGVLLLGGLPRTQIAAVLIAQRAALTVFILTLGATSYLASLLVPFKQTTDAPPPHGKRMTADRRSETNDV
jgi:uncharacterized protein (TIRG00374 family)